MLTDRAGKLPCCTCELLRQALRRRWEGTLTLSVPTACELLHHSTVLQARLWTHRAVSGFRNSLFAHTHTHTCTCVFMCVGVYVSVYAEA